MTSYPQPYPSQPAYPAATAYPAANAYPNAYAAYAYPPQQAYSSYPQQPYYEAYDSPRGVQPLKLILGLFVLLFGLSGFLSVTVLCGHEARLVRDTAAYGFGWVTALASILLAVGVIGLLLNLLPFPPLKMLMRFFLDAITSVALIIAGSIGTPFFAQTLGAVKDPQCSKDLMTARLVTGIFTVVGAYQTYTGVRG